MEAGDVGHYQRFLVRAGLGVHVIDAADRGASGEVDGPRWVRESAIDRTLSPRGAHAPPVVSGDALDSEHAAHGQRFLAERAYAYTIVDAADLAGPGEVNGPGWVDEPAD